MPDAFSQMVDRAIAFFEDLAANNTKDWFEPRKAAFRDDIQAPAELLRDVLRDDIARLTGAQMQGKLFRIHRDVRFSKDKTPFHTHLHLMWRPPHDPAPAWFFGASPEYLVVGMGIMAMQGDALQRYREFVDADGDTLAEALAEAETSTGARLSEWGPAPLKRVPKPFEADHPHADLLRRKALAVSASLPERWRDDGLVPTIMVQVRGLVPLWRVLDSAF